MQHDKVISVSHHQWAPANARSRFLQRKRTLNAGFETVQIGSKGGALRHHCRTFPPSALRTGRATRRCTQLASNVLSPSWLSSPSVGVMLLVAVQAKELHVLLLPGCNHVRWATLALRLSSESVRVVHDEPRTGPPTVLARLFLCCVQRLSLLVAAPFRPTHEREWLDVLGLDHRAEHGAPLRWFVPDEHPLTPALGYVQSFLPTDRVHPVMRAHHLPY